jgi:hypothetical protein
MKRSGKRGESKSRSVLCKYRGAIRSWVAAGSPLSAASPGAGCCCQNLSHCFSAPYAFASLRRGQRPARPRPLDVVAGNPKPRAGLLGLTPSGEVDRKPCTVRCGSCRPWNLSPCATLCGGCRGLFPLDPDASKPSKQTSDRQSMRTLRKYRSVSTLVS